MTVNPMNKRIDHLIREGFIELSHDAESGFITKINFLEADIDDDVNEFLSQHKSLEMLDFNRCSFKSVANTLIALMKCDIFHLRIGSSDLSKCNLSVLREYKKLMFLYLMECNLSDIDMEYMPLIANLQELNLSSNRLNVFFKNGITKNIQLLKLDIDVNDIVDLGFLKFFQQLEWLDLSDNKLTKSVFRK